MAETTKKIPVACMAPPLTDEALAGYRRLIDGVPAGTELRDALEGCYACVAAWWDAPESNAPVARHWNVSHRGVAKTVPERPLTPELVKHLWDVTPWMSELERLSPTGPPEALDTGVFDKVTDKALRDCAFHLLWHCKEVTLDREPMTADKAA